MAPVVQEAGGPVLLYDGECGLCNRTVRLLLRLDKAGLMRFAPLQGPLGQEYLRRHGLPERDFSSVVFVPDWSRRERPEFKVRTAGIAAALGACGGWGRFLGGALRIIPRPIRDAGYQAVARIRYKVFGPWRDCPLPRPQWRSRMMD